MATYVNRTVWFYEDGIGKLRYGVVSAQSPMGRLMVQVTDGLDDLRQIGIEPNLSVFTSEESALRWPPKGVKLDE